MLNHPTIDQLRAMKLDGMADAFIELSGQEAADAMTHGEWLGVMLNHEAANRTTKRYKSKLRAAKLRHAQASIEDIDYRTPRKLDKTVMQQLAACRWIAEHKCLLVTGPCGVGKTWLACALGQKACRDDYTSYDRNWVTESERGDASWRLSRPAINSRGAIHVTSRKVVWLFPEQLWFDFVPFFHRLQGRLTAQG